MLTKRRVVGSIPAAGQIIFQINYVMTSAS
nr:unnamed protein product [Callosobruchus chinensis]CAH7768833.1 unnamed protein product [Callosobruchus chinensis]